MIRSKIAMGFLWTLLALVLHVLPGAVGPARAQSSRKDDIVFNSRGTPLAGATVRVCAMPASGQPCTPLALIYSDAALTQALANPTSTDGMGNYFFYAAPGKYEIEISGPGINTKQIPNVILPTDPSSPVFTGAISAFSLSLSGNLTVNGNTTVVGNLASGTLNLANQSTPPGSASSGTVNLYTKTADKRLYYKDDAGIENGPLGAGVQANAVNTFTASQNLDAGLHIKGPDPYSDMARYGGYFNASPPATTASCTNASTSVTLAAALDFQDATAFSGTGIGNGIVLYKCGAATGLTTPPAPTVTPYGVTGGATTYNYKYVAEDFSGGLTAASAQGSATTGASTLGTNTVTLTNVVWNNTLNGEQIYTCSGNCNMGVNSPIRIDGFTNNRFNGNYTVIAQTSTTFTVYSPAVTVPAVTSESAAATVKLLACNLLTLPASSVASIETGGDSVLRYWVYRNNTVAFVVQSHDPYYEDCGMNMDNTRIPSYVPASPGSAVNKWLATTIASGGGTINIVVANAAGNTASGVTALHDNSQNLLAATNASHFSTPVYLSGAAPFNATTVFTSAKASNTKILLPTGVTINQPWVVKSNGVTIEGGQPNGASSFVFENPAQIVGAGAAYPVVLVTTINPNGSGSGVMFKNILFNAPALGQIAFVADFNLGTLFGLQMDNVSFFNSLSTSNVNTPAAIFKSLSESSIGKPGNRNACSTAQIAPGPPCMRFTTASTAISATTGGVTLARDTQINGFAMQGGGSSYQFDTLPFTNTGGVSPFGATDIRFVDGLREIGKGPFLRVAATSGSFWFKYIDDDAPNAQIGNGWVDAAYQGMQTSNYDFENMTTSVGGQVAVAGVGNVTFGPNGFSNSSAGTTGSGFSSVPRASGTGTITASGTANIGYLLGQPAAPNVAVGAHSSCASNCVAAGTYVYAITALDVYGNSSLLSTGTTATTDGTQTITISWTPVPGQAITNPFRGTTLANALGLFNNGPGGSGFGGTSYVDVGGNFYTNSGFNQGIGAAASLGSQGIAGQQLTLTNSNFKDVISGTLTASRTQTLPDVTGYIPVTSYVNSGYDNATRGNGSIGANWTVQQNGLNIASNQIQGTTAAVSNTAYWNANPFSPVQFAQVTITALNGVTDFPGVTVLASGTGASATYYDCVENSTTIFIQRVVNAGSTNLTSTASTGSVGDLLRLEIAPGGSLSCIKNGSVALTATDAQIVSGSPGLLISGNVATEKNWSGGNLHPLAQLDVEQDWSKTQHFTQGVAFGTETFTASPRSEQNVFLPGALTSTWTGATWTADKALTITRIQVQAKTAPAGCTTNAIVRLTDGTTPVNVTVSAAANDSGAISQNYAAGSSLQVLVQTAAAGCTTSPADANVTVQYRMQ
jgi:hypothetical protein